MSETERDKGQSEREVQRERGQKGKGKSEIVKERYKEREGKRVGEV